METDAVLKKIAVIRTQFPTKFGIPRQSGIVPTLKGKIIFEPEYRNDEALRGLNGFSHIWLLWEFSESVCEKWSPTVRPPRLGGNKRMGIFATRSPFRPNPIGLSSVKLDGIEKDKNFGTVLLVSGADLLDGTPIYDIKPYIPYTDSHPDAVGGFSSDVKDYGLKVLISDEIQSEIPEKLLDSVKGILSNDPRPAYQNVKDRVYGFEFDGYHIEFTVDEDTLTVLSVKTV